MAGAQDARKRCSSDTRVGNHFCSPSESGDRPYAPQTAGRLSDPARTWPPSALASCLGREGTWVRRGQGNRQLIPTGAANPWVTLAWLEGLSELAQEGLHRGCARRKTGCTGLCSESWASRQVLGQKHLPLSGAVGSGSSLHPPPPPSSAGHFPESHRDLP